MAELYSARIWLRLSHALTHHSSECKITFNGREATISSPRSDVLLKDTLLVVVTVADFNDSHSAWAFAQRLWATAPLSGLVVDGTDMGIELRGGEVFLGARRIRVPSGAVGGSTVEPSKLLDSMAKAFDDHTCEFPSRLALAIRLRSEAVLETDTAARFIIAVTSVEALTEDETWWPKQREALEGFIRNARGLSLPGNQAEELAERLETLRKLGVSASMRRLLDRLGLGDIKSSWKEVYELRSDVVHGRRPPSAAAEGLDEALALSKQIVLKAAGNPAALDPSQS